MTNQQMSSKVTRLYSNMKRLLKEKLAMNRTIGYVLLTRGWQFFSAPVTMFLIYKFFDLRLQGYYWLFLNLLALQMFFELGFNHILSLLASHEWSKLELNDEFEVVGDDDSRAKLASLIRVGDRWYRTSAVLFLPTMYVAGLLVIANKKDPNEYWMMAWMTACCINALSLVYQPRVAILEGCNQVAAVNLNRFFQAVTGSVFVWTFIVCDGGLWTVTASFAVKLAWEIYLVSGKYRSTFFSLREYSATGSLSWRKDVWPLQWRLAIQSVGMYFSNYFFLPVIKQYHGIEAAGRFGMTWQILSNLQLASLAWIQTRLPQYGMLVAQNKIQELEKKMRHVSAVALSLFVFVGVLFAVAILGLDGYGFGIADRFIDAAVIGVFVIAILAYNIASIQHSYVRLFKIDPFLIQNVITAATTALGAWYFGRESGAMGIAMSYLLVTLFFTLPMSTWVLGRHRAKLVSPTEELKSDK